MYKILNSTISNLYKFSVKNKLAISIFIILCIIIYFFYKKKEYFLNHDPATITKNELRQILIANIPPPIKNFKNIKIKLLDVFTDLNNWEIKHESPLSRKNVRLDSKERVLKLYVGERRKKLLGTVGINDNERVPLFDDESKLYEDDDDKKISTAWINTKETHTYTDSKNNKKRTGNYGYGYYECRYKYVDGRGIDNAFWLISGTPKKWTVPVDIDQSDYWGNKKVTYKKGTTIKKRDDEIDINEGQYPNRMHMTIHRWTNNFMENYNSTKSIQPFPGKTKDSLSVRNDVYDAPERINFGKTYNTFGLLYTPTVIQWFLNDTLIKTFDNTDPATRVTNQHFNIVLSTRDGGKKGKFGVPDYDTLIGKSMDIEYIRHYTFDIDSPIDTDPNSDYIS